jgi:hypothetical protein
VPLTSQIQLEFSVDGLEPFVFNGFQPPPFCDGFQPRAGLGVIDRPCSTVFNRGLAARFRRFSTAVSR